MLQSILIQCVSSARIRLHIGVCSETGIGAMVFVMIILRPSFKGDSNSIMTTPYHLAFTYSFILVGEYIMGLQWLLKGDLPNNTVFHVYVRVGQLQNRRFMQKMETKSMIDAAKFKLKQVFGSMEGNEVLEEDVITCLKFDPTGEYLCLGDNEGRVIIFKQSQESSSSQYEYFAEVKDNLKQFQSHHQGLDILSSQEVLERITDISWLRPQGKYLKMFTANTKVIKLWKCSERSEKNILKAPNRDFFLPKFQKEEPVFSASEIKTLPEVHQTDINSISISKNQQYLLSSDEQKCFLWNIEKSKSPYIAYDILDKKRVVSTLQLTCSKMHPEIDSLFLTGMNQNSLNLCDLRQPNNAGRAVQFGVETHSMKNFFTDMVSSIGSLQFTKNGKYIISRQYLNVKVWDIAQTRKPLLNVCVQESLKQKLVQLFEKNYIQDKFTISGSSDSSTILTGNYNNTFNFMDIKSGDNHQYEPNFDHKTIRKQIFKGKTSPLVNFDARKKISVNCFHPSGKMAAVSLLNCFFIYSL